MEDITELVGVRLCEIKRKGNRLVLNMEFDLVFALRSRFEAERVERKLRSRVGRKVGVLFNENGKILIRILGRDNPLEINDDVFCNTVEVLK
jgi:hypothetical protein